MEQSDRRGSRFAWLGVGLGGLGWASMLLAGAGVFVFGLAGALPAVILSFPLALFAILWTIAQLGRPGRTLGVALLGLVLAGSLHLLMVALFLVGMEAVFWEPFLWVGCSGSSVRLAMAWPGRILAWSLAVLLWAGSLVLLARPTRWWRLGALLTVALAAWLILSNYLAMVWDCDQDVVVSLWRMGPHVELTADPGGPVDPLVEGLPLSDVPGAYACRASFGRDLVLYRIGEPPTVARAPLLRSWPEHTQGVASTFNQADGSQRVVWLCGQDAPPELFERLAQELADRSGMRVESVQPLQTEPGTTRYEALIR